MCGDLLQYDNEDSQDRIVLANYMNKSDINAADAVRLFDNAFVYSYIQTDDKGRDKLNEEIKLFMMFSGMKNCLMFWILRNIMNLLVN